MAIWLYDAASEIHALNEAGIGQTTLSNVTIQSYALAFGINSHSQPLFVRSYRTGSSLHIRGGLMYTIYLPSQRRPASNIIRFSDAYNIIRYSVQCDVFFFGESR